MTDSQFAALFFLQLGVILVVCRLVGWLAARAGQPQVVAEMTMATTLMAGPLFSYLYRREPAVGHDRELAAETT